MKLFFTATLLFLALHLTAQYHFYSEDDKTYENDKNTITDIPLLPDSNKKVDVFFNDDLPHQPYYKVRIIEVSGSYTDYNKLLSALKQKAANEGFDAVKVLGRSESLAPDNSIGTAVVSGVVSGLIDNNSNDDHYHAPLINVQNVSAIGIKYKSQLSYVDRVIKTATIRIEGLDEAYRVDFNLSGLFSDAVHTLAKDYYLKNISFFKNADIIFKGFKQKNFQKVISEPSSGKMRTDSGFIRYIAYADPGVSSDIVRINLPSGQFPSVKKYFVAYKMNGSGEPAEHIISYHKKRPVYKDVYLYDNANRCSGFVRYSLDNGKEIMNVHYDFYSTNDLPAGE